MKKYFPIILVLLSVFAILSFLMFPKIVSFLGTVILLFSLAFAIYNIFQKHKGAENARIKISKETIQFVITLLLISFLAGLVGLFVNAYVSPIYGIVIGLISTLLISFGIGYVVKWGMGRLVG